MIVLFSLGLFFPLIFVFHFRNIFLNTLPLPLCFYYVRIFLKILVRVLVFFTYFFFFGPLLKSRLPVFWWWFGGWAGRSVLSTFGERPGLWSLEGGSGSKWKGFSFLKNFLWFRFFLKEGKRETLLSPWMFLSFCQSTGRTKL